MVNDFYKGNDSTILVLDVGQIYCICIYDYYKELSYDNLSITLKNKSVIKKEYQAIEEYEVFFNEYFKEFVNVVSKYESRFIRYLCQYKLDKDFKIAIDKLKEKYELVN